MSKIIDAINRASNQIYNASKRGITTSIVIDLGIINPKTKIAVDPKKKYICPTCNETGNITKYAPVPFYTECQVCEGTGKLTIEELLEL